MSNTLIMIDLKSAIDEELMWELHKGNTKAFTEIYNRYWGEMYQHAFHFLKDEDAARDVIQDVFSNLWLKASSINVQSKLSGLLYIATRNRAFNLIAKNKVRNNYLKNFSNFVENESHTQLLLDEKEILQAVETEINRLPEKMRLIFELSRKENLSHREIAGQLGLSEQTVKKQVHNALKILKPRLGAAGYTLVLLTIVG